MSIKDWPKEDRPREKLLTKGAKILTDAELIAIILRTGSRGKSALDIARDLLNQHGSLKALLNAPYSFKNIATYTALKAAVELGRRYTHTLIEIGEKLDNPFKTQQFLNQHLSEYQNEVFSCIFLDTQCKLLRYEELFHGTINEANIYPREILRRALSYNAAKLILAHNHPSGLAKPSSQDKEVTKLLQYVLSLVDIELVDHMIITHNAYFSFAESGEL